MWGSVFNIRLYNMILRAAEILNSKSWAVRRAHSGWAGAGEGLACERWDYVD